MDWHHEIKKCTQCHQIIEFPVFAGVWTDNLENILYVKACDFLYDLIHIWYTNVKNPIKQRIIDFVEELSTMAHFKDNPLLINNQTGAMPLLRR